MACAFHHVIESFRNDLYPGYKTGEGVAAELLAPDDETAWQVPVRDAAALGASLREHRADAMLFKRLALLRTDVPVTESLGDLYGQGAARSALLALCRELGEDDLPGRVTCWRE